MVDRLVKSACRIKPVAYRKGDPRKGVWTMYAFRVESYGYDFMLRTAQWVLDHSIQVDSAVTAPIVGAPETEHSKELHAAQLSLAECPPFMEETGAIALGVVMGDTYISKGTVIKIYLYNQTDFIHLYAMGRTGRHYFDRFISSLLEENL